MANVLSRFKRGYMAHLCPLWTPRYDINCGQMFEIFHVDYIFSVIINAKTKFFSHVLNTLGNGHRKVGV